MIDQHPAWLLSSTGFQIVADIIVYELDPGEIDMLVKRVEPALYAFCKGPAGGLERLVKIATQGKMYRRNLKRLPDPPRLLAEEWRERLMDKILVDEEARKGPNVCMPHSQLLSRTCLHPLGLLLDLSKATHR